MWIGVGGSGAGLCHGAGGKRRQVYGQRQQMIETLGPVGYGEQRAAALLREGADPQDIARCATACSSSIPTVF